MELLSQKVGELIEHCKRLKRELELEKEANREKDVEIVILKERLRTTKSQSVLNSAAINSVSNSATHQLYVDKLPENVSPLKVKKLFAQYAEVVRVYLKKNQRFKSDFCFAVVTFADVHDAAKVMDAGPIIYMGQELDIRWAAYWWT